MDEHHESLKQMMKLRQTAIQPPSIIERVERPLAQRDQVNQQLSQLLEASRNSQTAKIALPEPQIVVPKTIRDKRDLVTDQQEQVLGKPVAKKSAGLDFLPTPSLPTIERKSQEKSQDSDEDNDDNSLSDTSSSDSEKQDEDELNKLMATRAPITEKELEESEYVPEKFKEGYVRTVRRKVKPLVMMKPLHIGTDIASRIKRNDESYRRLVKRPNARFKKARASLLKNELSVYWLGDYQNAPVYWNPRNRAIIWCNRMFLWSRRVPSDVGDDILVPPDYDGSKSFPYKISTDLETEEAKSSLMIDIKTAIKNIKWKSNMSKLNRRMSEILQGEGEKADLKLCRQILEEASSQIISLTGRKKGTPTTEQIIANLDAIRVDFINEINSSIKPKPELFDQLAACQRVYHDAIERYNLIKFGKLDDRRQAQRDVVRKMLRKMTKQQFYQRIDMDPDAEEERDADIAAVTLDNGRRFYNLQRRTEANEHGYKTIDKATESKVMKLLMAKSAIPEEVRSSMVDKISSHLNRANQLENDPHAKGYLTYDSTRYMPGSYGRDIY